MSLLFKIILNLQRHKVKIPSFSSRIILNSKVYKALSLSLSMNLFFQMNSNAEDFGPSSLNHENTKKMGKEIVPLD